VIVDEMELVSRLKDVESLRPEAFEHARRVLRGAMADSELGLVSGRDARQQPRRRMLRTRGRAGLGLGIGVVAVGVAVALVATPAPRPAGHPGRPQAAPGSASRSASAQATPPAGSPPAPPDANPQLMTLADYITKTSDSPLPGNATLVISTQTNGSGPPDNIGYNLYADSGAYYWSPTESGLPQAVADHENRDNGVDAREEAAALYAVNGNLAIARVRMINATPNPFGIGGPPGRSVKASGHRDTGKALQADYDNYIWNNCMDALIHQAGNPQVRAGVLRLLATVPEVTVTSSTTNGRATLTLTASPALFGGLTNQVLTIDAKTGIPISTTSTAPGGQQDALVTYQISRVTVADIAAGKF
jgi:hypothetical protein